MLQSYVRLYHLISPISPPSNRIILGSSFASEAVNSSVVPHKGKVGNDRKGATTPRRSLATSSWKPTHTAVKR